MTTDASFISSSSNSRGWELRDLQSSLADLRAIKFTRSSEPPGPDPWENFDAEVDELPYIPDRSSYEVTFRGDGPYGPGSVLLTYTFEQSYHGIYSVINVSGLEGTYAPRPFQLRDTLRMCATNLLRHNAAVADLEALLELWIYQVNATQVPRSLLNSLQKLDPEIAHAFRPGLAHVQALVQAYHDRLPEEPFGRSITLPSPYKQPSLLKFCFGKATNEKHGLLTSRGDAILLSLFPLVTHHLANANHGEEMEHCLEELVAPFEEDQQLDIIEQLKLLAPFAHLGSAIFRDTAWRTNEA